MTTVDIARQVSRSLVTALEMPRQVSQPELARTLLEHMQHNQARDEAQQRMLESIDARAFADAKAKARRRQPGELQRALKLYKRIQAQE